MSGHPMQKFRAFVRDNDLYRRIDFPEQKKKSEGGTHGISVRPNMGGNDDLPGFGKGPEKRFSVHTNSLLSEFTIVQR